jgi:hypothetical protein
LKKPRANEQKFKEYAMNNWHVNVTFIDTETDIEGQLKLNFSDYICSDPFEVLNSLKGDDSRTSESQVRKAECHSVRLHVVFFFCKDSESS